MVIGGCLIRLLVLVVALLLGVASGVAGQDANIKSLIGLPGLRVSIIFDVADAPEAGLTTADLQTDVELQLRLAGIHVPSAAERHGAVYPDVLVIVEASKMSLTVGYAFAVLAVVKQSVTLASGARMSATTWNTGWVGSAPADGFRQVVRESVKDQVNKLLNDWLTVNPKK
jgi:hypothetical protein